MPTLICDPEWEQGEKASGEKTDGVIICTPADLCRITERGSGMTESEYIKVWKVYRRHRKRKRGHVVPCAAISVCDEEM